MRTGILARLRRSRRWLVRTVALTLLLPALLVFLPQPSLSAAAALDRDTLLSVCGQDGAPYEGDQDRHHDAGHDHCMVCGSSCPASGPSLASATPAFSAPPRRIGLPAAEAWRDLVPLRLALRDAIPPRGPPAP